APQVSLPSPGPIGYGAVRIGYDAAAHDTRESPVDMTPTDTPPAWLETVAKLDALVAERVPVGLPPPAETAEAAAEVPVPEVRPRPRLGEPPVVVPDISIEAPEEVDRGWHGYDAGALLPSTLALGAVTAGALWELRRLVPAAIVVEAVYAPLAALWAG